jgi:hypothetical protein
MSLKKGGGKTKTYRIYRNVSELRHSLGSRNPYIFQLLHFIAKTMDPGFRRGDVYWVFGPDVGILILFHHPARGVVASVSGSDLISPA